MLLAVHQGSNSVGKFTFCPQVSLSASLTKTTVAANACRCGSHPEVTGSRRLGRYEISAAMAHLFM